MQHLQDPEVCELCRFCGEESETSYHILIQCPRFVLFRRSVLEDVGFYCDSWLVEDVIKLAKHEEIRNAMWLNCEDGANNATDDENPDTGASRE